MRQFVSLLVIIVSAWCFTGCTPKEYRTREEVYVVKEDKDTSEPRYERLYRRDEVRHGDIHRSHRDRPHYSDQYARPRHHEPEYEPRRTFYNASDYIYVKPLNGDWHHLQRISDGKTKYIETGHLHFFQPIMGGKPPYSESGLTVPEYYEIKQEDQRRLPRSDPLNEWPRSRSNDQLVGNTLQARENPGYRWDRFVESQR